MEIHQADQFLIIKLRMGFKFLRNIFLTSNHSIENLALGDIIVTYKGELSFSCMSQKSENELW
jgi:hypothetical protein